MDFQCTIKLAVLALSFVALAISPSYCVPKETLYAICSQTQNEETCVQILQKDPTTNSATLHQLSLISINLTRDQASENAGIFIDFRDNGTASGPLEGAYGDCVSIYSQMTAKIDEAYQLSLQRRYKDINQPGEARDLAYKCENGLPLGSSTAEYSEAMILTCEASSSVNQYVASQTMV